MLGPPGATPGPPSRLPGGGFVSSRWVTPPMARPRETSPILLRSEVEDRYILIAVSAALWNVLVITLALLAEIGDPSREPRAGAVRSLKKRTWSLQSLQQADGPIPRLIPSMEELGWTEDDHGTNSPAWSPSKDDLDEGILRSEGFESFKTELNLASDVATSNSTDLVVFGSFFPGQAEVTWNLLQRFLSTEEERRFARKALLFLATSPEAQEEKFWKRKAALLLTLARLGADRGTLLAALLDGEDPHDDARQDALTPLLMGNTLGMEVGHLLDERQAVGDLVTLFDLHAQEGDPGRGSLDTWPASAQLCRQLFVQSCRDTRPVLMELMPGRSFSNFGIESKFLSPDELLVPASSSSRGTTMTEVDVDLLIGITTQLTSFRLSLASSQAQMLQKLDRELDVLAGICRAVKKTPDFNIGSSGPKAVNPQPPLMEAPPMASESSVKQDWVDAGEQMGPIIGESNASSDSKVRKKALFRRNSSASIIIQDGEQQKKSLSRRRSASVQEGPRVVHNSEGARKNSLGARKNSLGLDPVLPGQSKANDAEDYQNSGTESMPLSQPRARTSPEQHLPSLAKAKKKTDSWFKQTPMMLKQDKPRLGRSKTKKEDVKGSKEASGAKKPRDEASHISSMEAYGAGSRVAATMTGKHCFKRQ
eukprot:symbB.v1.2.017599.t1/scaffold1362.1/size123397/6